jgi:site-specific DNA-methyltransferase (adenine-specific)
MINENTNNNKVKTTQELIPGNALELIKNIESNTQDLIILDPLFDISEKDSSFILEESFRVSDNSGSMWHFIDWQHAAETKIRAEKAGWTILNWVIWSRVSPGTNTKTYKNSSEHLLWFVKNPKYYTFNKQFRELSGADVLPYYNGDGSPRGWFYDDETGERKRYAEVPNTWNYSENEDNVWHMTRPGWSDYEKTKHPMQKPRKLCDRILLTSSNIGDNVLDIFCGSGSFIESAQRLNRNCKGFEQNPEYIPLIQDRLEGKIENKRTIKQKEKTEEINKNKKIISSILI